MGDSIPNNRTQPLTERMSDEELPPARPNPIKPILTTLVILGIATGVTILARDIWLSCVISFGIQWVVSLLHAIPFQTERFYDLTGGATYVICTGVTLALSPQFRPKNIACSILVIVWALRLSSFLFSRIKQDRKDKRFDLIKQDPFSFFVAWNLQGLWVFFTALPVYYLNANSDEIPTMPEWFDFVGWGLWVVGMTIEVVSDKQKSAWNKTHKGQFVDYGLWRYSRHPNYFGEILLWVGMFVVCASKFVDKIYVLALSPLTVTVLLTLVSGIPMLEKSGDRKWGDDPDYQRYKREVNVLIIGPRRNRP